MIVLDPSRCIPKGGTAYCAHFGFQGSARELLSEFAADGGAILFVDNLDFYSEAERATVADLLRAAATINAVSVITTARPGFGVDDADWLPAEALTTLNRAAPVWINELSEGELAELSVRAPELAPLLAPDHPANRVSNNLFRLNRLALRAATAQSLRTEIDLAEQWWTLADGVRDEGLRDRLRLLMALGVHALGQPNVFDCGGHPPSAIDALRSSGSLRELRPDRVDFQHDVLREWAIAFTLDTDPSHIDALPLTKPATAALARGIELAARLSLERATDDAKWRVLIEKVSRPGAHRSWRRFALLAVTRSEAAEFLLPRASQSLLADGGDLLKELLGSVAAVEVTTLGEALNGQALDVVKLPSTFAMPKGAGWPCIIEWLLKLGAELPANAVPSVVRLFHLYAFGTFASGPFVVQICTLNDQNFFDLTEIVVRALDEAYFGSARRPSTPVAVGIRNALAEHLVKTWGWRRAQRREDGFTEFHFGYAVASMFFNGRSGLTPSSCYLTPLGIDRLGDFISVLEMLVAAGPCRKVTEVLLNLLEVSPRPEHLPLLALAGRSWWEAFENSQIFWVEAGVGNRLCRLVQSVLAMHVGVIEVTLGMGLAHLAADLVALGVSEAPRLEATLGGALS